MIKKFSNKNLVILLVVLVAVIVAIQIGDSKKSNRTFKEDLANIDTAKVTEMLIYSSANNFEEVRLYKEGRKWKLPLKNSKTAIIDPQTINGMFQQLLASKPKRLAAKSKDKWTEFQVDSSATRVKVNEGKKTTLDLMIGRFSFNQQARTMATYVRLFDEEEVYAVDGFFSSFNQDANNLRNKRLLNSSPELWNNLYFKTDSESFELTKRETNWFIDGEPADSAEIAQYLSSVQNIYGQEFADDFVPQGKQPDYQLKIETDSDIITVDVYRIDSLTTYISSSQNESFFDAEKGGLVGKVFPHSNIFR